MTRRDGELALATIRGVAVAHWDPGRRTDRRGRPTRFLHRVRNVGDLLGPVVVGGLVRALDLPVASAPRRLLAVGSILHLARDGDVVWGAGVGDKPGTRVDRLPALDLRAVRGPATSAELSLLGATAVPGLGDPVLLLGGLRPSLVVPPASRRGLVVVPNLNDLAESAGGECVVSPREPWRRIVRRIARSELVVGSSLHAIVIAESLGVRARFVRSGAEGALKYADYYAATGRDPDAEVADSVADAVARGGAPVPVWDPRPLLAAFPADLWGVNGDLTALRGVADAVERTLGSAGRLPGDPRTGVTDIDRRSSVEEGARR
jgi:pyruvyltransferase